MRVLLLACDEPGTLLNGPSIILTKLLEDLRRQPEIEVRVGLLSPSMPPGSNAAAAPEIEFRCLRKSAPQKLMMRAALRLPLIEAEKAFLESCHRQSAECDVALWLGSSWDPVSLALANACVCPVIHHPTDSIALAEKNRLPGLARPVRLHLSARLERAVLRSGYAAAIYNSPADSAFAALLSPESAQRIFTLPIGVDTDAFHPADQAPRRGPLRLIFSGVMNYRPNVDAAVWLVREVLPRVSVPVELAIVGRCPAAAVQQLGSLDSRVVVTGAVPDVSVELRKADAFVAPMVSGGGISNKVLEAMACGLPVVATALVTDNFANKPSCMFVAETAQEIAAAIDALAGDAGRLKALSIEAREFVRNWSWHSRSEKLLAMLAAACTSPVSNHSGSNHVCH